MQQGGAASIKELMHISDISIYIYTHIYICIHSFEYLSICKYIYRQVFRRGCKVRSLLVMFHADQTQTLTGRQTGGLGGCENSSSSRKGISRLPVNKASHDFCHKWSQIKAVHMKDIVILSFQFGYSKLNTPNIEEGWAPDRLIGCEKAVECCYQLSSLLLTCSPLRWAGLQSEVSLWLPGTHHSDHHQHHHQHSGQAAQLL